MVQTRLLPAGPRLSIGCFQTRPWENRGCRGQQGGQAVMGGKWHPGNTGRGLGR
jgi:hypothetical protein